MIEFRGEELNNEGQYRNVLHDSHITPLTTRVAPTGATELSIVIVWACCGVSGGDLRAQRAQYVTKKGDPFDPVRTP